MATETLEIQLEQLVTFSGNIYKEENKNHYIIILLFLFLLDAIHDLGGKAGTDRNQDPDRGELLIDLFVHELTEIELELLNLSESLPDDLVTFFTLLKRLQDIKNNKIKESVMTPEAMKEPVLCLSKKTLDGEDKLGNCYYKKTQNYISVYFDNIQPELNLPARTGLSRILQDICSKLKELDQDIMQVEDISVGKLNIQDILNIILLFCFCNSTMEEQAAEVEAGARRQRQRVGPAPRNRNTIQNQIDLKFLAYEVHLIFKDPGEQFIGDGIKKASNINDKTTFISYLKEADKVSDNNITINFAVDTSIDAMSKMYTDAVVERDEAAAAREAAAREAAAREVVARARARAEVARAAARAAGMSAEAVAAAGRAAADAMAAGMSEEEVAETADAAARAIAAGTSAEPLPPLQFSPPQPTRLQSQGTMHGIIALSNIDIMLHEMLSSRYDTAGVIHRTVVESLKPSASIKYYYNDGSTKLNLILKAGDFVILNFHLETRSHGDQVVVDPKIEIWFNKSLTTLLSSITETYNKDDKKVGVGGSIWHSQGGIVTIMETLKIPYSDGYKNRTPEFLNKCKVHHYKTMQDFGQGLEIGVRSVKWSQPQPPPPQPPHTLKKNLNFFSTGDKLCAIIASIINKVVFLDNHKASYADGTFYIFGPKSEINPSTQSSAIQFERAQYYKETLEALKQQVEKDNTVGLLSTTAIVTEYADKKAQALHAEQIASLQQQLAAAKRRAAVAEAQVDEMQTQAAADTLRKIKGKRGREKDEDTDHLGGKQFLTRRIRKRKQKITQRAKAKPKTKPKAKPKTRGKEKGRKKRTQKRHRKIQRRYKNKTKRLQREKKRTTRKK